MLLKIFADKASLSRAASEQAASAIRRALAKHGRARIVAATAASQIEFLDALTQKRDIDWTRVEAFHLDEYIGLPVTHPGSFRKMLLEQLIQKTGIVHYYLLDGDANDPAEVAQQVGEAWFADISQVPKQALSMSVRQILKAQEILAVVPDARKAHAVKACFEGVISPMAPASILRNHPNATVYLDRNSASLLDPSLSNLPTDEFPVTISR